MMPYFYLQLAIIVLENQEERILYFIKETVNRRNADFYWHDVA